MTAPAPPGPPGESSVALAIDTGGTFTDLIVEAGGGLRLFKAATTPADPVCGILDVLEVAAASAGIERRELLGRAELLIHGTTHAINALVTANTARTAFLTTAGHPDVLLLREGGRTRPFDHTVPYPEPLVPRALTFEVRGRILADGSVHAELDEEALAATIERLRELEVEAVGVCLLWSIVNPAHELRVGELLAAGLPGVPVTLSHRLNPTLREYRRASSTCMDASLKPLMGHYFESLERRLAEAGFEGRLLVVTSQGGMLDAAEIAATPIQSLNSGPSMAPLAGRYFASRESGSDTAVVVDTGGTTFDVTVVRDGLIPRSRETWIGPRHQGHITGFPSVEVTSVGAGGGSIAWVDGGGLLRVGPRSAGSDPGPACYRRGGSEPTVTDACVVLGYIDPDFFLGGRMSLDREAAEVAITRTVAEPLGLSPAKAAAAVLRIATENMVHAIEDVTVGQGIDPRRAVIVGGGGAAGLNLVAIARRLGCSEVLIPGTGAALSAAGALLSDLAAEAVATYVTSSEDFDRAGANAVLARLTEASEEFVARAVPGTPGRVEYAIEARYRGQNWDIELPLPRSGFDGEGDVEALVAEFHRAHERLFAISEPATAVEVVGWRARGAVQRTAGLAPVEAGPAAAAGARSRRAWFQSGGWTEAAVVRLETLASEVPVAGPAVIESSFTTVVVDPDVTARKTGLDTLVLELGPSR